MNVLDQLLARGVTVIHYQVSQLKELGFHTIVEDIKTALPNESCITCE